MLELDKVDRATFAPCVGQTFDVIFSDGRLPLTLAETRAAGSGRPGAAREPFALTFHGAPGLRLPQQIYRLENAALGLMEIFLVQTGLSEQGSQFEAIFT